MSKSKRYYWLKLKEDFFRQRAIKKLRRIAGGDTYTIVYLKMLLLAMKDNGKIALDGADFSEELALELDEEPDNVKMTVVFLLNSGLMEEMGANEVFVPGAIENVGSESDSLERVRKHREKLAEDKLLIAPPTPPKTNAERQKAHRAKVYCEKQPHVPFIEDWHNRKRYGGNYYLVIYRDKAQCALCGKQEDLCVHHIDGYDETKPENNETKKMITLCRACHSGVHAGNILLTDRILSAIGYNESNESNVTCNAQRKENRDKRIENREKREEKEREVEEEKKEADSYEPASKEFTQLDEQITEQFNCTCLSYKKVKKLSEKRKTALSFLIEKYNGDLLVFKRAFFLFENHNFLKSKADDWACFDWLIKPENFEDVLKGRVKDFTPFKPMPETAHRPTQEELEEKLKAEGSFHGWDEIKQAFDINDGEGETREC